MTPARCIYCGNLTNQPVRLPCVLPSDESDETEVHLDLPLCPQCANSWNPRGSSITGGQSNVRRRQSNAG